jgi:precorrin-6B methylase 2
MTEKPSPFFNIKQTKRSNPEARTTLDNLHQMQIGNMQKEREDIGKMEELLENYNEQMKESTDIVMRTQLEEKIQQLMKKKEEWESNKPVYDYFFEAGEILYNYYDIQEKINSGSAQVPVRKVKATPGSVLAA